MENDSEDLSQEPDQSQEVPDPSQEMADSGAGDNSVGLEGETSVEQEAAGDFGDQANDENTEAPNEEATAPTEDEPANDNEGADASQDIDLDRNESEAAVKQQDLSDDATDSLSHLKTAEEQLLSAYQNACTVLGIEPIKVLVDAISTAAELGDILTTIELKGSTRR